jgi:hypothetical protein
MDANKPMQGIAPDFSDAACRTWNVEGSGLSIAGNSRQTRLIMT